MSFLYNVVILLAFVLFFLPTGIAYIAADRKHLLCIFLVNTFLGLTGVGWVVALVWAILAPPKVKP